MRQLTTLCFFLTLLFTKNINAQDTLDVYCGTATTAPDFYFQNGVYLDSSLVTYGIGQGVDPGFLVTVFDTDCQAWDTLPFEATASAFSISQSFKFVQDNPTHLLELDSLINVYIPNDHPFVIYTPMSYSGSSTAAISPQLAQTFTNYWGPEAAQTESIIILFGIKGYPNSFQMDTLATGIEFMYSTVICPHSEQTLSVEEFTSQKAQIVAKPNPSNTTITLIFLEDFDIIEVLDITGQCVQKHHVTTNQLQLKNLPDGMYFVVGSKDSERSEPLRIQFY